MTTARGHGTCWFTISVPTIMPTMAVQEPIDMSKSLRAKTTVSPQAITPSTATDTRMLRRLIAVRKMLGFMAAKNTMSASRPSTVAYF